MIHKYACEILSDRLVEQNGAYRRINTARHGEQHLLVPDLSADGFDFVLDVRLDIEFFANLGKTFLLGFIHGTDTFLYFGAVPPLAAYYITSGFRFPKLRSYIVRNGGKCCIEALDDVGDHIVRLVPFGRERLKVNHGLLRKTVQGIHLGLNVG